MGSHKAARKIGKAKVVGLAPDVCKTPMGSPTPPIPYSVLAKLHISASVSPNVFFTGCPAFTVASNTAKTWGDEPGVANGVKSGTVGKKSEPITKSATVRVNGNWLIRHDDLFFMNNKNTVGKLVYPGGGGAGNASGVGLPPASIPPESFSLLSKEGLLNKLSDVGKKVAMDVVMGGDPMDSLKSMVDPVNLIQSQLGSMLGPVGGQIASKLLKKTMGSKGKKTSHKEENPLANPKVALDILKQSGMTPQQYVAQLSDKQRTALENQIKQKSSLPEAYAKSHLEPLQSSSKPTKPTKQMEADSIGNDAKALAQSQQLLENTANTCIKLSKKKVLSPPTDWQALMKQAES